LLLSEHVGDCEAPCQRLCALHAEIPSIIRSIQSGNLEDGVVTLRQDTALAGIVERLCAAPCEKGCRRGQVDEGVSIKNLMQYVADWSLKQDAAPLPAAAESSGRRVAIVGAGITGLSTAHYLALAGHASVVLESKSRVLDRLRTEQGDELPDWVVDGELEVLRRLGVEIRLNERIDNEPTLRSLESEFDAVVLACGEQSAENLQQLGIPAGPKGVEVSAKTSMTKIQGVFAGGTLVKGGLPILKSVQMAKSMAACVSQCLNHETVQGLVEQYNHTMGRLKDGEIEVFAQNASPSHRVESAGSPGGGFADQEALEESERCLHCDCRKNHDCKLRIYSDEYGARQSGFKGEDRATFKQVNQNAGAIFEPGKCVKCGLCVRVTRKEGAHYGFTFVGRGFEVNAGVSLDKSLSEGLEDLADKVIDACPTGAISKNEKQGRE
jgi:NADPH-dependent glutamate synthase beta subunit-like oxidoreductase/ferredoxin